MSTGSEPDDAALAGTGKHLGADALRAWTGLIDASRMLDHLMADQLRHDHEMTHREYEILVRIDGHGGAMRLSVLATQIVASQPLVSQTINRLQERGWVERQASGSDGRGVDAVLTAEGRAVLAAASKPHAELVEALYVAYLGDDLAASADGLQRVADHLRAHWRGVGCGEQCVLDGWRPTTS